MVHVSSPRLRISIHLAKEAQLALPLTKEVIVPVKYSDFADVFSRKSANVLSERAKTNEHAIKLKEGKKSRYRPIYSLVPVEFESFKTYLETNLSNDFIRALKSPAGALILFVCKGDGNICLCVNYRGLNNLTIKNWYPLPLIGKSLNWLGHAKQLTQLDLTSVYHQMRMKESNE